MKLRTYLKENLITLKAFAETTGLSKQYISQIGRGRHMPSESVRKLIEFATNQNVHHIDDWTEARTKP